MTHKTIDTTHVASSAYLLQEGFPVKKKKKFAKRKLAERSD